MARILDLSRTRNVTPPIILEGLVAPENRNIVGTVSSMTAWGNPYNFNYGSNGPSSSPLYIYDVGNGNSGSTIQALNMLTGDGLSDAGSSLIFYIGDAMGHHQRRLQFSNGNRVGHKTDLFYYNNSTSYAGRTFRILPVRNTTNSSITRSIGWGLSNYWSSGYEGYSVSQFNPNSTLYSTTTGGTWTILTNTSSGSTSASSVNVTVPPNTTILLMLASSHQYYTTYRFGDENYFWNLNTTFPQNDNSLICDMRMLSSWALARVNGSYTSINTHLYYQAAAALYGDR
jgi:hypothetical protein